MLADKKSNELREDAVFEGEAGGTVVVAAVEVLLDETEDKITLCVDGDDDANVLVLVVMVLVLVVVLVLVLVVVVVDVDVDVVDVCEMQLKFCACCVRSTVSGC